jgi:hypothetical protein
VRSCDVLTESLLQAVLRRRLPAEQRAVLARHLDAPCEACLDLLERWTTEEMISELHASDNLLSWGEQERVFAAVSPGGPSRGAVLRVVRPERRRRPRLAWGMGGAAAIALALLVMVTRPDHRDLAQGLKGAQRPTVALVPFVGARTPTPHVIRALASGKGVARGELLLLRIRMDTPAWIYLLSQKQGESTELVWPMGVATRHASGEFELAEKGAALAIDPEALGTGARLIAIASPERIVAGRLRIQGQLRTRADIEEAFPGCGVDLLPVIVETEPISGVPPRPPR